jgi:hypothetical protein
VSAYALNDPGVIAGSVGASGVRPAVWAAGPRRPPTELGLEYPVYGEARAIDKTGRAAGTIDYFDHFVPVVWDD